MGDPLKMVQAELARYRHPLVIFAAQPACTGEGIDVSIQLRDESISAHHYMIHLSPRELQNPRFPWAFQKTLYDSLHDYVIELFQDRP